MILQHLTYDLAISVVVVDCANLWNPTEHIEGLVVEFIDMGDVWIAHNAVWKFLHISNAMSQPAGRLTKHSRSQFVQQQPYLVGSSVRT